MLGLVSSHSLGDDIDTAMLRIDQYSAFFHCYLLALLGEAGYIPGFALHFLVFEKYIYFNVGPIMSKHM